MRMCIATVVLLALLCAHDCLAASHCVRSDVERDGDGTAWNEAPAAGQPGARKGLPATLVRGDTYYLAGGEYGQYVANTPYKGDEKYITIKKATAADHGTDTGWLDAYGGGQAVFSSAGPGRETVLTITTSYWIIDGQTGGYPHWTSGHGIKITTRSPQAGLLRVTAPGSTGAVPHHIQVHHTEFAHVGRKYNAASHADAQAISIKGAGRGKNSAGGHRFSYNYFHDNPVGVFWTYDCGDVLYEYNYMDTNAALEPGSKNQGAGMTLYGARGMTIRHSVFKDVEGSLLIALYTWHGQMRVDDVKIYGNVFYYSPGIGWDKGYSVQNAIIGTDGCSPEYTTERATNVKVYNNTFANICGCKVLWIDRGTTRNEAMNNIFYKCQGVEAGKEGDFKGFAHSHNFFYGNTDYRDKQGKTSRDADWASAEGGTAQIGTASPFRDAAAGDFELIGPTAPGIPLGSPFGRDLRGKPRPLDAWDRGALQSGGQRP